MHACALDTNTLTIIYKNKYDEESQ